VSLLGLQGKQTTIILFFSATCVTTGRVTSHEAATLAASVEPHSVQIMHTVVSGVLLEMDVGIRRRGLVRGLKGACLFMIAEVSIRCQKNLEVGIRRIPAYTPPNTPLIVVRYPSRHRPLVLRRQSTAIKRIVETSWSPGAKVSA